VAAFDIALVAAGAGLVLVAIWAWIWYPYLKNKPEPQHEERRIYSRPRGRAFEDLPARTTARRPAEVERPEARVNGDRPLPETWAEYMARLKDRA